MIFQALLTVLLLIPYNAAYASEALRFNPPTNHKENLVIDHLNQQLKTTNTPYLIAKVDLNNDLIDEYITKPASPQLCRTVSFCPYHIIALPQHQPLLIGQFDAHNILVEDTHKYGVRNLRVYNKLNNNFTSSTALWNPFSFLYEVQ